MERAPKTGDHTVPQMYLRRFGVPRNGQGHQLDALDVVAPRRFQVAIRKIAVVDGFYWGVDADGVPHHQMEELLTAIEGFAATEFRVILDKGKNADDDAFPTQWPPRFKTRLAISWWIAAQVLRTNRQRRRLEFFQSRQTVLPPEGLSRANLHLDYILEMLMPMAALIFNRPWGIGFSSGCLVTSDTPVLIMNGQDDDDQLGALEYWDVYVPLDPHRCLFLPGLPHRLDRWKRGDHRFQLHGGHAMGLNQAVYDAAVRHIFFHPDHDLTEFLERTSRLPTPGSGAEAPRYLLNYGGVPPGFGVERRWLTVHAPKRDPADVELRNDADVIEIATELLGSLDRDHASYQRRREPPR